MNFVGESHPHLPKSAILGALLGLEYGDQDVTGRWSQEISHKFDLKESPVIYLGIVRFIIYVYTHVSLLTWMVKSSLLPFLFEATGFIMSMRVISPYLAQMTRHDPSLSLVLWLSLNWQNITKWDSFVLSLYPEMPQFYWNCQDNRWLEYWMSMHRLVRVMASGLVLYPPVLQ